MLRSIEHVDNEHAIGIGVNAGLSLRDDRWEITLADSANGMPTRNEGDHLCRCKSLECKVLRMRGEVFLRLRHTRASGSGRIDASSTILNDGTTAACDTPCSSHPDNIRPCEREVVGVC